MASVAVAAPVQAAEHWVPTNISSQTEATSQGGCLALADLISIINDIISSIWKSRKEQVSPSES